MREINSPTAFWWRLLLFTALGAAGSILAALRAGRRVFAATAVAFHGRHGATCIMTARRAAGGHQDSCGKNRSQGHHGFHVVYLWLFVALLELSDTNSTHGCHRQIFIGHAGDLSPRERQMK